MTRRVLAWLLLLTCGVQAVPPHKAAPKKKKPAPVVCQVVVHVVLAGTSRGVPGVPVQILKSRLRTDDDGRAVFKQVPPHPVTVEVQAGKPKQVEVQPDPKKAVEVTVPVVVWVDLSVHTEAEGEGRGVAGAQVLLDERPAGETDAGGSFTARVRAGGHSLRLTHPSFQFTPSILEVQLDGGEDQYAYAFEGRPLTGRLKIRLSVPGVAALPGGTVHVTRLSDGRSYDVPVGPDGVVLTEPLLLDRYELKAQAPGATFDPPVTVNLSAPGEVWTTLVGKPAGAGGM